MKTFESETADAVLRILRATWADDIEAVIAEAKALGYGSPGMKWPDNDVLHDYLKMILEPLTTDGPFHLGSFQVGPKIRTYLLKHPELIKVVPPAELLIYYRVLGGLKGLVSTSGARINFFNVAKRCCELREI